MSPPGASSAEVPRRWLVLSVGTRGMDPGGPGDPSPADRVAELLIREGARGAWEDRGRVVAYLPEPGDPEVRVEEIRARLRAELGPGAPELETSWQAHEDWAESWKRGLEPRRIVEGLVVTPSWCDPEARPGERVLVVDPGMAFGTAEHGTTRGCLRLLARALSPGESVLDVGAGSGILAVAAALLGAGRVEALESDPWAVAAARENVELNGVGDRVVVEEVAATASGLATREPRDGVVANIEPGILTDLLPGFAAVVRATGWLILSGIPVESWQELRAAATGHGFALRERDEDEGWVTGLFHAGDAPASSG